MLLLPCWHVSLPEPCLPPLGRVGWCALAHGQRVNADFAIQVPELMTEELRAELEGKTVDEVRTGVGGALGQLPALRSVG